MTCPLCRSEDDDIVWQDASCRVIAVDDPDYPGFCRVVWNGHVAEMTDLPGHERQHLLAVVMAVEEALRTLMQPAKINLASFGNMVPHLHWHVIPRFTDDRHYPQPVWGQAQRAAVARAGPERDALAALIGRLLLSPSPCRASL